MKDTEITQANFNKLLNWLDTDRETAARKYQSLHHRLVLIFLARKTYPAEDLADKVFNIALRKIDFLSGEYEGDPTRYFYGIVRNLVLEKMREPKFEEVTDKILQFDPRMTIDNTRMSCLSKCLQNFTVDECRIFIKYYTFSSQTKAASHQEMADSLGISVKALRTRIYRLKKNLEKCVKKCVKKINQ